MWCCVRIFLTDFKRDYAGMNEIFSAYFAADKRPARTTVGSPISPAAGSSRST